MILPTVVQTYRLFLVDFPAGLQPDHLDVPADEQALLFAGLSILHTIVGNIYDHFAHLTPLDDAHWSDEDDCYRAVEGPVRLLWALGTAGQLVQEPDGLEIKANRKNLDAALKRCHVKDPKAALGVLEKVGLAFTYHGADGLPCTGGYKKCVEIAVRYPAHNDPLLRAMAYYAAHLPQKKSGRKENDYGAWSIFVEEKGLSVRVVFNGKTLPNLLTNIPELSPRFQETYLNSVACKDCTCCGKHVFYTHGDHVHRLCKSPWYFSPHLSREDLPDIERLVDLRLADASR